eukprot:383892-Rhodomonas_salina.1
MLWLSERVWTERAWTERAWTERAWNEKEWLRRGGRVRPGVWLTRAGGYAEQDAVTGRLRGGVTCDRRPKGQARGRAKLRLGSWARALDWE